MVTSKDRPHQYLSIPLHGRLRTSTDGTQLSEGDFQVLKNMRYGELSPQSIPGMTKINSSVIHATNLKPRSGFHFRKSQPSETHVLVQSLSVPSNKAVIITVVDVLERTIPLLPSVVL